MREAKTSDAKTTAITFARAREAEADERDRRVDHIVDEMVKAKYRSTAREESSTP